ncbi:MAG: hypothetical protein ACOC36_02105 [Fibrobacterota bacterium]
MGAKRPKRPDRFSGKGKPTTGTDKNDAASGTAASKDQDALLKGIKNRIRQGFYNSDDVLEDLSDSFTKAVDVMY